MKERKMAKKKEGISGMHKVEYIKKDGEKVQRDAFIYLDPKPPQDKFAQCGTCMMFTGSSCTILGKDKKVDAGDSCALYVHGKPQPKMKGKEHKSVTPEEAGFVEGEQVRCENCVYGDKSRGVCKLFEKLNREMPADFDLKEKIHPKGCCNAWKKG